MVEALARKLSDFENEVKQMEEKIDELSGLDIRQLSPLDRAQIHIIRAKSLCKLYAMHLACTGKVRLCYAEGGSLPYVVGTE